jgi:hypothetical protein
MLAEAPLKLTIPSPQRALEQRQVELWKLGVELSKIPACEHILEKGRRPESHQRRCFACIEANGRKIGMSVLKVRPVDTH